MDEYDDWFSDLEDDDLLALADLYKDDFGPDGLIQEDEIDLWEDEGPGDDRPPDAAEKDVAAMTPEQIEQFLDMILESPEKIEPLFKNVKKHPVYAQVKAEKKAEEKASRCGTTVTRTRPGRGAIGRCHAAICRWN